MKKKLVLIMMLSVMVITTAFALGACNQEFKGFDIEVAKAVGEKLGLAIDFKEIDWGTKEIELEAKNIDLIWNGLTIDDERKAQMCISTPYLYNKQVAVIRKQDAAKFTDKASLATANGMTYEDGSAGEKIAAQEFPNVNSKPSASQMLAFTAVKAGTYDVVIVDSVLAGFYTGTDTNFQDLMIVEGVVLSEEQYGVAARKEDIGTMDKINTALSELYADGTLAKIAAKYGLENELCDCTYVSRWDSLSDAEKAGWNYLTQKGNIVVGYTLYAPIAFFE